MYLKLLLMAALILLVESGMAQKSTSELLIKFSGPVPELGSDLDVEKIQKIPNSKLEVWELNFPLTYKGQTWLNLKDFLTYANGLPNVEYAEANNRVEVDQGAMVLNSFNKVPDDNFFAIQWALNNTGQNVGSQGAGTVDADVDAVEAWDIRSSSPSTKVAILDSGIDWSHPDLAENIWQNLGEDADGDGVVFVWNGIEWGFDPDDENGIDDDNNGYTDDFIGWDFVNDDNNPMDDLGSGTYVSGVIGAKGDNAEGVSGLSWDIQLMGLKTMDSLGLVSVANVVAALNYAIEEEVDISNFSWFGDTYSIPFYDALEAAQNSGLLCVTTAGVGATDLDVTPIYPASYDLDNIIVVAGTDFNDSLTSNSNFGASEVDLCAPANYVATTNIASGYIYGIGPGFSAAYVTAASALLKEEFPNLNYLELKNKILSSVDTLPSLAGTSSTGGRLNLYSAFLNAPPRAEFTYSKNLQTVDFEIDILTPLATYTWDFGDGNSSTDQNPSHNYSSTGSYDVCLIGANGQGADTSCQVVEIPYLANCVSSADSLVLVDLFNSTNGSNWTVPWDLSQPINTWIGVHSDANGCDVVEVVLPANNLSGPVPDMTALSSLDLFDISNNPFNFDDLLANLTPNLTLPDYRYSGRGSGVGISITNGAGNVVTICATGTGGLSGNNTFEWYRANMLYYTSNDECIVLTTNGTYSPNVYNSLVTRSAPYQDFFYEDRQSFASLGIVNCTVEPGFSVPTASCSTETTFTNTTPMSTGSLWYVDGVLKSFAKDFTYTFLTTGSYTVELVAENGDCSDTHSEVVNVGGSCCVVEPAFNSPAVDCAGTYFFENTSTGATDFEWHVNGQLATTDTDLTYEFTNPGNFEIDLIATDGQCTVILSDTVTVVPSPTASFDLPLLNCPGFYTFVNTSAGATIFEWSVNGNLASTQADMTRNFSTAGTYYIDLVVSDGVCSSMFQDSILIDAMPSAGFSVPAISCADTYTFTNTSSGATNYKWLVNSSVESLQPDLNHNFQNAGTYYVELVAYNGNCPSSLIDTVEIFDSPITDFSIPAITCSGTYTFTNTSSNAVNYEWYVNGILENSSVDFTFNFNNLGSYQVDLIAYNGSCAVTKSETVVVQSSITASFDSPPSSCLGTYDFVNTSSNAVDFVWNINGVFASSQTNLTYTFNSAGSYDIQLVATNGNCSENFSETFSISSAPIANFDLLNSGCSLNANFSNSSTSASSYEWFIDGASVSNQTNLSYSFPSNGTYNVSLIASEGACQDTLAVDYVIGGSSSAALDLPTDTTFCGVSGTLDAQLPGMLNYIWDLEGEPKGQGEVLLVTEPGTYILAVIDYCGYASVDSIVVSFDDDCVWPGDANYDQTVDYMDLVAIGQGLFGQSGSQRPNASTDWYEQSCPDWNILSNGIDLKHIDCNGNGVIDALDPSVVPLNYTKTWGGGNFQRSNLIQTDVVWIRPTIDGSLSTNSMVNVSLELVDNDGNPTDVYAVGLHVDYGLNLGATVDFSESQLGIIGQDLLHIGVDFQGDFVAAAATRYDNQNTILNGKFSDLKINKLSSTNYLKLDVLRSDAILNTGEPLNVKNYLMNAFYDQVNQDPINFYILAKPIECGVLTEAEAIILNGTAPFTYEWSNGTTSATAKQLQFGTHYLTITDANGLTTNGFIDVGEDAGLVLTVQTTDASYGQSNGAATASVVGGSGVYEYHWSNGQNTATLSGVPAGVYELLITDSNGCSEEMDVEVFDARLNLEAKMILQGPYDSNSGLMKDVLRQNELLPLNSPYDGSISTTSNLLAVSGNQAIVDWVLVKLLDPNNQTVLSSKSGLLRRDGSVVDENGNNSISFDGFNSGDYLIAVSHRNHVGVVTPTPQYLDRNTTTSVDFTQGALIAGAVFTYPNGKTALFAGDTDFSENVDAVDRARTWNDRNKNGYLSTDCNLDGSTDAEDRTITWNNRNKQIKMP